MSEAMKVTLGETEYTIQRFRGLKAILAIAAVTRIAREVPDILNDAILGYQKRNKVRIDESMSKLERWKGFTKEDFDEAEHATGVRVIEIPAPMSDGEQIMQALPALLEQARREIVRLFAILIIPNAELREADESDEAVEDALDKYKNLILYDAEIDQLADLILMAQEVLADQLGNRQERLGKLIGTIVTALRRTRTPILPSPGTLQTEETEETKRLTEPTPSSDAPTSLIDSPPSTDGREATLSTESRG